MIPEKCRLGTHGPLIYGLGLMGDAILCLGCGKERHDEYWPIDTRQREDCTEITDENKEHLWPLISEARTLPNGIEYRTETKRDPQ